MATIGVYGVGPADTWSTSSWVSSRMIVGASCDFCRMTALKNRRAALAAVEEQVRKLSFSGACEFSRKGPMANRGEGQAVAG
jgi:hypothetical protein